MLSKDELEHWRFTFAGQAMQGLVSGWRTTGLAAPYNTIADESVVIADSLLAKLQETAAPVAECNHDWYLPNEYAKYKCSRCGMEDA